MSRRAIIARRIAIALAAFVLLCGALPTYLWNLAGRQPVLAQDCASDRNLFIQSQSTRVHINIDRNNGTWTMSGTSSIFPHTEDEVIATQLQAVRIYESYGLYVVDPIDEFMGRMEYFLGKVPNSGQPWHHDGTIDSEMLKARCFN